MSGFLSMWTDEAARHVQAIDDVGQTLADGWTSAKSAIDGAVSGIGDDIVGQSFAAGFLAASNAVRYACDEVPPGFDRLATGGSQSVGQYVVTSDQQVGLLRGLDHGPS